MRPSASASRASAARVTGSPGKASDSSSKLARASSSWLLRIWSVDQLLPEHRRADAAVEHAAQVGDGVGRPLLAHQVVHVHPVSAWIVGALRDQLAADLLAARDLLAVRQDHEVVPGLVVLRVRLDHLAQGFAPQGVVVAASRA